jgi:hypothetical protein
MATLLKVLMFLTLVGCTTTLPALPNSSERSESLPWDDAIVVGHVITVLMGPTTRGNIPKLRFFELVNIMTHERIRIDVDSEDGWFVLPLPLGSYEFARLQIAEGAFLANAGLSSRFNVVGKGITYVGTWRLGIEPPQYDRSALISVVTEDEDVIRHALAPHYSLGDYPLAIDLLSPTTTETRLYEVPPYPRVWWFRRHHTS